MIKVIKAIIAGLSDKEKKLLYGACVVLAVVFFDRLIVGPFTERSAMIQDQIDSQRQMTEKNIRILEFRDKIIVDALEVKAYYVPSVETPEERIGTFLGEIESLAKEAEITLTNIDRVQVPEGEQAMPIYELSLECSGQMKNLVAFFHGIATADIAIRIASFNINVTNVDQYIVDCSLNVDKLIVTDDGIPIDHALAEDFEPAVQPGAEVVGVEEDGFFITDKVVLE